MVKLKLGALVDFKKSIFYTLENRTGGKIGIFFQFYVFLWFVITSFFVATTILSLNEGPDPVYIASAPVVIILLYIPIYLFWIYEDRIGIEKRRIREMQDVDAVNVEYRFPDSVELGFRNKLYIRVNNPTEKSVENIWIRVMFPVTVLCDKPVMPLGSLKPHSSLTASLSFVPTLAGKLSFGYYDLYLEVCGNKHQKAPFFLEDINVNHTYLCIDPNIEDTLHVGHDKQIIIKIRNNANVELYDMHVKCSFSENLKYDTAFSKKWTMIPGAEIDAIYNIIPCAGRKINLGHFEVLFKIAGNNCKIGPTELGERIVQVPDVDVDIKIPDTLYSEAGNSIGIYVHNRSNETIHNVCFNSCFSSFIDCHNPNACIPLIQPESSGFTSLVVKPVKPGKIDLGNLNFSFEVNEILCTEEPFYMGMHQVI